LGESSSIAIFVPEHKFAAICKSLDSELADYKDVFEKAVLRLPEFKASRLYGFTPRA
jgi:hypothetical protein